MMRKSPAHFAEVVPGTRYRRLVEMIVAESNTLESLRRFSG
ncbi:hypothetical protein ACPOL_0390 [Acidisarcina polymorpha]|uniref:Uncharacterized protein n=1 Tax=Acidisarcina polymorpha TaxID=2211140 RepID=A0A2Z5FSH3_9BACT|nr:hypothetical protein ACPOL_0390 [Acidisarcina polymorpha]